MSKYVQFALALASLVCLNGALVAGEKKEEHKHDDHKAPHGGALLEVGEHLAHIELVRDEKSGKITLYILGKDAKTAVALTDAPKINLKGKAGKKQLETKSVGVTGAEFEATDELLKAHELEGRIVVTIAGKKYNVDLKDDHGHDHK